MQKKSRTTQAQHDQLLTNYNPMNIPLYSVVKLRHTLNILPYITKIFSFYFVKIEVFAS